MLDVFLFERGINGSEWQTGFNKVSRKHFDFVLLNPEDYQIVAAIELDDSSHSRTDRINRDIFVEDLCKKAGLTLFRFKAKYAYSPKEIEEIICGKKENITNDNSPLCNKCGAIMIKKTSTDPKYAGKSFWACPGYPKCRNIIPIDG